MAIRAQMHDGTVLEFPDNTDPAVVDKAAKRYIAESTSKQVEDVKPAGFSAKETALALGQGIVGAGKSLTDVFGAENVASQALGKVQTALGEQFSPERQAEMARRQVLQEKASKGTLTEEISAYLGGVTEAPVQALAQGLGSIVPYIGTGIIGGIAKLGGATITALNTVVGTIQGAGSIKGSLYDNVKQELEKTGMSSKEAAEKASKAQEYLGENFLDIAGGAALGGIGARFGVEKALVPGAKEKLSSSLIPRIGKAALAEAPVEALQGGQEQLATNRALQKLGFDVDTFQGVAGAAARDAAIGALVGGAVGIRGPKGKQILEDAGVTEEEKTALLDTADKIAPPATVTTAASMSPDAMDLETLLAPSATKVEDETFDYEPTKTSGKNVEELIADNARIQAKLDAGEYKGDKAIANAKAKQARQQAEIDAQTVAPPVTTLPVPPVTTPPVPPVTTPPVPPVTTLPVPPAPPAVAPSVTPTKESIYEVPKKEAGDYLAAIESKTVKPNPSTFKKHLKALGIEVPTGAGFSERAIQAIKATLGGQDVIQPIDAGTSGVSAEVPGGPDTTGAAAGVTEAGLGRPGVDSDQSFESTPQDGASAQQPALEGFSNWLRGKGIPVFGKVTAEDTQKDVVGPPTIGIQRLRDLETEYLDELDRRQQAQNLPPVERQDLAAQMQAALEKQQTETETAEAERVAALQEIAGKTIPQTKTEAAIREEYELSREALAGIEVSIPPWDKLTADEKDKYLSLIKNSSSAKDFDDAGKALAAYREQKKGSGVRPAEQRVINSYEDGRPIYQRSLVIDLPAWNELSPEAQNAYTSNVKNNTVTEQNAGFEAVATQLEKEGKGIRGVSREGIRNLQLKGTEEKSKVTAAERIAREAAAEASAQGKGEPISKETKAKLEAGDINGVLSDLMSGAEGLKTLKPERGDKTYRQAYTHLAKLRKRATALTFRILAGSLNKLKFTSTVVTDPTDATIQRLEKEGKLAEYDPKTDTFYFTPGGFDESTVLHEIVHAGTVKIINQFLTDPSKLTAEQREAAEHLQKIYDHSKKRLGGRFKNAYENLYEFVSYALTDNKFQIALAEMQARPLAKYTGQAMELWKQFTQALSKMFGLYSAKPEVNELTAEMYQQVAKEYGSMDPDELYQNAILDEIESLELGPITAPSLASEGKETEVKVKKQKTVKQARKFLTTFPGYEGNLLLEMSEIFGRILAAPEAGIDVAPLAKKEDESAVEKKMREDAEIIPPKDSAYKISEDQQPKNVKYFKDLLFTKQGWRRIASKVQNERYAIKHWQDLLDLANKTIYEGKNKINNINDQLTLATGRAKNLYNEKVEAIYEKLDQSIYNLSKAVNLPIDETLDMAHRILEALHEPERRLVKYLMVVPLSDKANIPFGNTQISASDLRDRIFKALNTKSFTKDQATKLRDTLNAVVFTTDANGNQIPNPQYVDPLGNSPKQTKKQDGTTAGVSTDINNDTYNVTGMTAASIKERTANYDKLTASNPEVKKQMDAVIENIQKLHKVTTDLNKEANYWSQPVTNRVNFYGFKNYVPLKGVTKHTAEDEMLDFDGNSMGREVADILPKGGGKELQEIAYSFDGRVSVSDNPVLQSMSDAVRAAMRAGRKDLTQSIKNSLKADKEYNPDGQGLIMGKVKTRITFEQRQDESVIKSLPRENTVFHYNSDGSIDVLEINDKPLREAIRRTYKNTNPLVEIANKWTSRLGQLHTRYNYNFAPLNFVRDALTNAWTIGAEMGPKQSAKFIADISTKVVARGAFKKAMQVAALYESKDIKKIEALAKTDPLIKEMHEFIQQGGMVEYLQGISLKANFQRLYKDVGRSGVMRNWEQFNKLVDIWTDMFELTSRSAAYTVAKKNFMEKGLSETAAQVKAAAYAKNLANFEQVGEYGRGLGSIFMFFRPSATGAVRAIEAALPAFQKLEKGDFGFGSPVISSLPSNFTAADKAAFKKNFLERQKAARYMLTALASMGSFAYMMAIMMADDDDLGRNKVMNDDMSQWTRFARFHIPGFDTPLQLPWGFGLGAFAASGAQLTAVMFGQQSIGKALGNVATQISLDSFVPIPFSRMPIQDNPAIWFLDSITPSMIRPALEWTVNKNGLGQDIYNDANRRMGDAYVGGDNIPETYKVLTKKMFDMFEIDVSLNILYFLANSYADGPMRVVDLAVNSMYLAAGAKEFKAKTDVPLIGSFIGAEPNVDGREFASIEKDIKSMEEKMNMLKKADLDKYDAYLDKYPLNEEIVEFYNKEVGKHLNKLRKEANEVRFDQTLNPKERTRLLKENKEEQNIIKYDMIQQFKAYGLKP
jgi:hypothetical protein